MIWIGLVAVIVCGLPVWWFSLCVRLTTDQRIKILSTAVCSSGLLWDLSRVDFDRHLWFVFTFRDYRRLYASATWRANGWTRR